MRKKTNKEFLEMIKDRPLIALDEYNGTMNKIRFKCDAYGHIWETTPNLITSQGTGCPKCRMVNEIIEDHGDWLEINVSTPSHPNSVMLIDKADWCYIKSFGGGRVTIANEHSGRTKYARIIKSGTTYKIHRLILPNSAIIDHKDFNGLNNRRNNLRECTHSQNQANTIARKTNSCGVKGVHKRASSGKWIAQCHTGGKQTHIGCFETMKDASNAYEAFAKKIHGDFYYKNKEQ